MNEPIISDFAAALVADLKARTVKVTGQTQDSITPVRVSDQGFQIEANASIVTLFEGRKPTSGGNKGGETLQEVLLEWIKNKGIIPYANNGKTPTQLALSWMMSKSIHAHGTKLYQQGGGNDYTQQVLTEGRLNAFLNTLIDKKLILQLK